MKNGRSLKWLEGLTGFTASHAVKLLARAGLTWHTAEASEIKRVIVAHLERERRDREERRAPIVIEGRGYTRRQFARALSIDPATLHDRELKAGSLVEAIRLLLAEGIERRMVNYNRAPRPGSGRKSPLVTIDGETRRRADWLALIGLTKQGLHKAACRAGRELSEELTLRVRARRSDAAHAPASSVASDQRRGMVSRAGAVSACVASGSGANDTREVAA